MATQLREGALGGLRLTRFNRQLRRNAGEKAGCGIESVVRESSVPAYDVRRVSEAAERVQGLHDALTARGLQPQRVKDALRPLLSAQDKINLDDAGVYMDEEQPQLQGEALEVLYQYATLCHAALLFYLARACAGLPTYAASDSDWRRHTSAKTAVSLLDLLYRENPSDPAGMKCIKREPAINGDCPEGCENFNGACAQPEGTALQPRTRRACAVRVPKDFERRRTGDDSSRNIARYVYVTLDPAYMEQTKEALNPDNFITYGQAGKLGYQDIEAVIAGFGAVAYKTPFANMLQAYAEKRRRDAQAQLDQFQRDRNNYAALAAALQADAGTLHPLTQQALDLCTAAENGNECFMQMLEDPELQGALLDAITVQLSAPIRSGIGADDKLALTQIFNLLREDLQKYSAAAALLPGYVEVAPLMDADELGELGELV